jgi:hypothetical protein
MATFAKVEPAHKRKQLNLQQPRYRSLLTFVALGPLPPFFRETDPITLGHRLEAFAFYG